MNYKCSICNNSLKKEKYSNYTDYRCIKCNLSFMQAIINNNLYYVTIINHRKLQHQSLTECDYPLSIEMCLKHLKLRSFL